jgi:hypothetical protein
MKQLFSSTRRSFLQTLGRLCGGIFLIPLFPSQSLATLRPEELLIRKVARTLRGPRRAVVLIGEACLQETLPERNAQRVAQLILSQAPALADACRKSDDECFLVAVRQQIQHDFATGKVMNMARYILSATEGRLCSLAALVERQGL